MPIWLRRFTYQKIVEARQQEADAYKKSSSKTKPGKTNINLANPDKSALPDYSKPSTSSTFNTRVSRK